MGKSKALVSCAHAQSASKRNKERSITPNINRVSAPQYLSPGVHAGERDVNMQEDRQFGLVPWMA